MLKPARIRCCLFVFFTCSFFIGVVTDCVALSKEKVVLTTHNLYPYGSYPPGVKVALIADETFQGIAVDTVRCVFEKMDTSFEIQVLPWKRAQFTVKAGNADGFFAASQNDSRDEFAQKTGIIADQNWNWYILKENPVSPQDQSFKEKASVGGFVGANMLKWMQENNYNVMATPQKTEGLLEILLARRVDAVMANNNVMQALLQKYGVEDQVKIYLNTEKPLYVYFSNEFIKVHPTFILKFNNFLTECRQ